MSAVSLAPPRSANVLDRSQLTALVAELAADPDLWRELADTAPGDRRWWTRLIRSDAVDVWLITWPGREGTDLHDHGESAAALTVVDGALEQVMASRGGEVTAERFSVGTLLTVEPRAVHDVRNPTDRPAVSIHAYSPPLEQMTFYDRKPDGLTPVRTVRGDEPEIVDPW